MSWNKWMRQIHRWLSVAFMISVIGTFFALRQEEPAAWVSYVPLAPLALLFLTGLYLFVLPYFSTRRRANDDRKAGAL